MERNVMKSSIFVHRMSSPLGNMLLAAAGGALCGIYFAGQKHLPEDLPTWREDDRLPAFAIARTQLAEYFAGTRASFALPLAPSGTAFQQVVWNAIATVPFGATISYTELAARAGHPGSARAAGAATGRNPLSIVVPCHRIVGADGSLTGYAGGIERKRSLLALERAAPAVALRAA
jgi:methylated-DNA-[protein]-cysteine S-methyltransferase